MKNNHIQNPVSHSPKLVEMRFHKNIADHDLAIKIHKIEKFLLDNHQVRIRLQLMGREKSRPESGVEWLNNLVKHFDKIAKPNKAPSTDYLSVVLFPTKNIEKNKNT